MIDKSPKILNENGGWCWYQDKRVIVDDENGNVLFTSVPNLSGKAGKSRDADIEVTAVDPASLESKTAVMATIALNGRGDDHNVGALWRRPDGRYLCMYTGHNYGNGHHGPPPGRDTSPDSFYRITTLPGDIGDWGAEQSFTWPSNNPVGDGRAWVTYSNLHHLSDEGGDKGRLYNIARSAGNVWQIATSDDWGENWTYRGILSLPPSGGRAYSNGYVKFADNGRDRIDFIITEAHPRDYNNGVYHGYMCDGKSFDAAGTVIDKNLYSEAAPPPETFTPVFKPNPVEEDSYHHAWTVDLEWGEDGALYGLYSTRYGTRTSPIHKRQSLPGNADHRLFLARFDGSEWQSSELAKMGPGLWDYEEDYTGLGAFDPADGRTVYVSTPIDPRDGKELDHHELFKGNASEDYTVWTWIPVTECSDEDQLRPRLAVLGPNRALLVWLRGTYGSQHNYDLAVMGQRVDRD
jgi:hypothetical protein